MRLPRDISGAELVRRLARFGYQSTHQTGSHVRLTTKQPAEHHLTIPMHNPLRVGTLNAILRDVAQHQQITREQALSRLFN